MPDMSSAAAEIYAKTGRDLDEIGKDDGFFLPQAPENGARKYHELFGIELASIGA